MKWWVEAANEEQMRGGVADKIGGETFEDAVRYARARVALGQRVLRITGPSGEDWDEETVKNVLANFKNSN